MAETNALKSIHFLTKDFHVWPDLHGNRSPLADPTIKGMISGLKMSATIDDLAMCYLGFVQALSVSRSKDEVYQQNKNHSFIHIFLICSMGLDTYWIS